MLEMFLTGGICTLHTGTVGAPRAFKKMKLRDPEQASLCEELRVRMCPIDCDHTTDQTIPNVLIKPFF